MYRHHRSGKTYSKPRTKGDIIAFSNSDTETGDESVESVDITDINPNVKFLPATVEGLAGIHAEGKHKHRYELVFLLNDLLRQDDINRDDNAKLNNMLEAGSTMMENAEEEGRLKK